MIYLKGNSVISFCLSKRGKHSVSIGLIFKGNSKNNEICNIHTVSAI